MTPEEHDLIAGLFDRLRNTAVPDKDADAERLIAQYVRQMPIAPYMLVQTVLIQDHALAEAEARIRDLEAQVSGASGRQSSGSGSFLGGLRPPSRSSSAVPPVGRGALPDVAASPWGTQQSAPQVPQMPPMPQQPSYPAQASSGGGFGGFLRSAMTTAAGVAGGMMIGDALRGMMGGSSSPLGGAHHSTDSQLGSPQPQYQDASNNDPGAGGGWLASDAAQDRAQDAELESDGAWDSGDDSTDA